MRDDCLPNEPITPHGPAKHFPNEPTPVPDFQTQPSE
jgi:hypothetical protein